MTLRYWRLSFSFTVGVLACSLTSCSIIPTRPDEVIPLTYLYDSLTFDVAAIQSCRPSTSTLIFARNELDKLRVCKKEDIVIRVRDVKLPPGKIPTVWMVGELFVFYNLYASVPRSTKNRRHMFVAYLQGLFVGNRIRPLAGIQIYDNYFVVFKDGAGGIEPSTFVHEFFHALGLRKESKEPRAHCPNRGCLMHPTLTEEYHYLCADCRKELKTLIDDLCRGKTKKLY